MADNRLPCVKEGYCRFVLPIHWIEVPALFLKNMQKPRKNGGNIYSSIYTKMQFELKKTRA